MSEVTVQHARTRSSSAATVSGDISEGVPPPKKIEPTSRPGTSSA
jgi:hypothetical protein